MVYPKTEDDSEFYGTKIINITICTSECDKHIQLPTILNIRKLKTMQCEACQTPHGMTECADRPVWSS